MSCSRQKSVEQAGERRRRVTLAKPAHGLAAASRSAPRRENSRLLDGLTPTATTTSSKSCDGAPDDVEVAVGDRVERPGADGSAHAGYSCGRLGVRGGVTVPKRGLAVPLRSRLGAMPVGPGRLRAARPTARPRPARPATSQPWSTSSREVAVDLVVGRVGYGGSRNTTSYGAHGRPRERRGRPGRRRRSPWRSRASWRCSAISAAVRRSCSTSVTTPAPRDQASSPTAPEPAYRSRKRSPWSEPHQDSMAENSASRTRSLVGRVLVPRGVASRRPPADPPMIRVMERARTSP